MKQDPLGVKLGGFYSICIASKKQISWNVAGIYKEVALNNQSFLMFSFLFGEVTNSFF